MRAAIVSFACLSLLACATSPEAPGDTSSGPGDEASRRGWKVELPAGAGWQVESTPECILAMGLSLRATGQAHKMRQLLCYDPEDGHQRWSRSFKITSASPVSQLHEMAGKVVYQDGTSIQAFSTEDGETLWSFDPGGRTITRSYVQGQTLLLGLEDNFLVGLDGEGAWIRGLKATGAILMGAASVQGEPAFLVQLPKKDNKANKPSLALIPLRGEGGGSPIPPFPEEKPLWDKVLEKPLSFASVHGDTVLVTRADRQLVSLALDSGQERWSFNPGPLVLPRAGTTPRRHRAPTSMPAVTVGTKGSQAAFPQTAADRLATIPAASLLRDGPRLSKNHLLWLTAPGALFSHGVRQGVVLSMREVSLLDPHSLKARWTMVLPSTAGLRLIEEVPDAEAFFIMRQADAMMVDAATGQTLWRRRLPEGRTGWTDVASLRQGLYVVYGRDPKPRLEAWLDAR